MRKRPHFSSARSQVQIVLPTPAVRSMRVWAWSLLIAAAGSSAAAQPASPARTPVGLDVSLPAAKRLAGVQEFVAAGDWGAAIKALELVTNDFSDALVEVAPGHAVSMELATALVLASLPDAGLAAYRRRNDPAMQALYQEAKERGDRRLMQQVVRDGFASSYGDDAIDWLAEDALERGDLDAARAWWTALLPAPVEIDARQAAVLRHPDADIPAADLCARLVLCSLLQGDRDRAAGELEVFRLRFGETAGDIAGIHGPLAATLSGLLKGSSGWRPPICPSADDAFPPEGELPSGRPQPSVICWNDWLAPPESVEVGSPGDRSRRSPLPVQAADVTPSIWRDTVLIADLSAVRAIGLVDGAPRWPAGPDDDGTLDQAPISDASSAYPIRGTARCIGTVANSRYFVRTGSLVSTPATRAPALPPSRLACFDLQVEGRLAWSVTTEELLQFADGRFSGAPVVADGRVYIAVRRTAPQVEIGLACLDAASGTRVWERRLCTALESPQALYHRIDDDVVAAGSGLLYVVPGAGLVAACEAESGNIRWAVSYDGNIASAPGSGRGKASNAAICHGGRLFVKPSDADSLTAFDAINGRQLWTVRSRSPIDQLLGVDAGRLIAAGDQLWGFAVENGRAWRFGFDDPEGYGFGRGAVRAGRVYWPTRDELFIVETAAGQMLDRIPLADAAGLQGGNVVIAGDRLLIASSSRLIALGPRRIR
ncbi:MAG: PQQ-binding-like beta-propeller repeat protein [Planctomycetaceae bacterium]